MAEGFSLVEGEVMEVENRDSILDTSDSMRDMTTTSTPPPFKLQFISKINVTRIKPLQNKKNYYKMHTRYSDIYNYTINFQKIIFKPRDI